MKATDRRFMRGTKDNADEQAQDAGLDLKDIKKHQRSRSEECAISGEVLRLPIVICQLGNLYNKECLLECLLNKSIPPSYSHIRSLKDVKEIKVTLNPSYKDNSSSDNNQRKVCQFVCPVTQQDFNGIFPFFVIWPSGQLLSEKAIREVGEAALQDDYGPFTLTDESGRSDLVKVLPTTEELPAMVQAMDALRAGIKQKKSKKRSIDELEVLKPSKVAATTTAIIASSAIAEKVLKQVLKQQKGSQVFGSIFSNSNSNTDSNKLFIGQGGGAKYN